eukprot:TRINITY_DN33151_c0_g1_i2.p1 TRINITY_DN33151_c0_g1~~TRINITY_DN33151_c0_g1_i2.p1  ORF type:complete len:589 (-),score=130.64 TRINITY_DN33151_c0_g1_i2:70-1836(-)
MMIASALRSLVVFECDVAGTSAEQLSPPALVEVPLEGTAVALEWDSLGERVAVAVAGSGSSVDKLRFLATSAEQSAEEVALPAGARVTNVGVHSLADKRKTWVAASCTDGALRILDASPGRTASVVRTSYSHGVAATAVEFSAEGRSLASGSASGHVVVQPFQGNAGPTPLPGLVDACEGTISGLRFSPLHDEMLASSDVSGNLQVWDVAALRHTSRFPAAHHGAVRGLSFSTQNSDLLISGGDDAALIFWDVKNSKRIQEVSVEAGISSLSYHSGGYLLAGGTTEGSILIYDLRMLVAKQRPAEPVQRFNVHHSHGGALLALAFAPFDVEPDAMGQREGAATSTLGATALPSTVAGHGISVAQLQKEAKTVPAESRPQEVVEPDPQNGGGAPTSATLESMMGRLSTRYSSLAAAATAPKPLPASTTLTASKDAAVPPLPQGTSHLSERPHISGAPTKPLPETPVGADSRRATRYSIGSPDDVESPWWQSAPGSPEEVAAADKSQHAENAASSSAQQGSAAPDAGLAASLAQVLGPLLSDLRRDFRKEVQEAQCVVMEQNFRLHAELRKDLDELRAEVQQLRGELRLL